MNNIIRRGEGGGEEEKEEEKELGERERDEGM